MTAHERIDAAIAAHDKATPGPWMFIHGNKIIDNSGEAVALVAGKWKQNEMEANRDTISAAPDLVDEVVRLREWQQEALLWLSYASDRYWEKNHHHDGVGRNNDLDRLIAEAQEAKNA